MPRGVDANCFEHVRLLLVSGSATGRCRAGQLLGGQQRTRRAGEVAAAARAAGVERAVGAVGRGGHGGGRRKSGMGHCPRVVARPLRTSAASRPQASSSREIVRDRSLSLHRLSLRGLALRRLAFGGVLLRFISAAIALGGLLLSAIALLLCYDPAAVLVLLRSLLPGGLAEQLQTRWLFRANGGDKGESGGGHLDVSGLGWGDAEMGQLARALAECEDAATYMAQLELVDTAGYEQLLLRKTPWPRGGKVM